MDFSVPIDIKQVKKLSTFFRGNRETEVTDCFPEFLNVESATRIVIHHFEHTLHAEHASCAARSQLLSEHLHQLVVGVVDSAVTYVRSSLGLVQKLHFDVACIGKSRPAGCWLLRIG